MKLSSTTSHWPLSIVSSVTSILNLFLPVILVRILPQEAIGEYKIFFLYLSLAPAFALTGGLVSNVPFWSGKKENSNEYLKASFQSIIILAIFFTTISILFSDIISNFFGWSEIQSTIFSLAIFGTVTHQFIEDCLIAKGRIWFSALFSGTFEVTRCAILISVAWITRDSTSIFLAYALVASIKAFFAITIGFQQNLLSFNFNSQLISQTVNKALPISFAALFSIFIEKADQFILSNYLSSAQFAVYSLGCLIVPPLFSIESSIMRVAIPQIASEISSGNSLRAANLHKHAVQQLSLILLPASFGLMLFAEPIITLLFTEQYLEASSYLRIFALSYLIMIVPFDATARALGNTKWIFNNFIIFTLISILFAFYGAIQAGAYGALVLTILARFFMRLSGIHFSRKSFKCKYYELLPVTSLITEFVILVTLAIISLLLKPVFSSIYIWFIICGSSFVILYIPLAIYLRNKSELKVSEIPNILLVVQSLQIGGMEKLVVSLASELQKRSVKVHILAYDQPDLPESDLLSLEAKKQKIDLFIFKKPAGFSIFTLLNIIGIVLQNKINIVHTHNIGPLLYASLANILTFGKFRIIHTNHSFTELEKFPRYRMYEKAFSYISSKIVVVSQEIKETYKLLGVNSKKIVIIPNGISFESFKSASEVDKFQIRNDIIKEQSYSHLEKFIDHKWILVLARVHPLKGQDIAIQIWNSLEEKLKKQSVLIFVGPENDSDFYKNLINLKSHLSLQDHIIFAGPSLNTSYWYKAADIFLSCSRLEGMPLAVLEALYSDLPLVLSKIEGHRFIADYSSQFQLENTTEGKKILSKFIIETDSQKIAEYSINSKTWLCENFSIEAMADKYLHLYRESLR